MPRWNFQGAHIQTMAAWYACQYINMSTKQAFIS